MTRFVFRVLIWRRVDGVLSQAGDKLTQLTKGFITTWGGSKSRSSRIAGTKLLALGRAGFSSIISLVSLSITLFASFGELDSPRRSRMSSGSSVRGMSGLSGPPRGPGPNSSSMTPSLFLVLFSEGGVHPCSGGTLHCFPPQDKTKIIKSYQ